MIKFFSLLLFLTLFSCLSEEENPNFLEPDQEIAPDYVWVCHNPDSVYHGKVCVDDHEPGQCLTRGKNSHYCWMLHLKDCKNDIPLPYNEVCQKL